MAESVLDEPLSTPNARRSVDILLLLTAFVVAGLAAAWFLAERLRVGEEPLFDVPELAGMAVDKAPGLAVSAAAGEDAAVNLEKARMAASAGMLVTPSGQNALYFYSLALDAEPDNAEAKAELAGIAETVAGDIRTQLAAEDFGAAARLASRLANVAPENPVIVEVQETLIAEQQRLVMEAIELAREGKDAGAAERLALAESLPQVDDALIVTARQEITAIRAKRVAAERAAERRRRAAAEKAAAEARARAEAKQREQQARAAAAAKAAAEGSGKSGATAAEEKIEPASPDVIALGREKLAAGRLVRPPGDNALEYLIRAESGASDAAELAAFRDELISAFALAIRDSIDEGALEEAEEDLLELETVSGAEDVTAALQAEVDRAFIRAESARVISVGELLATKIVPPVYPRLAIRRDQEGWVQVEFTVLADGSTADVEVVSASPEKVFDRSSIQAVTQWQFRPRVFRGQAIDQRVTSKINFTLQDG